MKLSELIKKLNEDLDKYGDVDVVVQCRDSGGDYPYETDEVYCFWSEQEKVYKL